jgi:hypothetical protein
VPANYTRDWSTNPIQMWGLPASWSFLMLGREYYKIRLRKISLVRVDYHHGPAPPLVARESPSPPYQVSVIAHAFCCVLAFSLVLPGGAILARYLRT